jgi:GNAT superfamily N-acetyltransferase
VNYEIRALGADDGCNALSVGNPAFAPLKTFLRKEAKKLHKENIARTFVLVELGGTRIWAYVTTLCTQVSVEQLGLPQVVENFRYRDFPAIKVARLAVDSTLQGNGIGPQLLDFVIGFASEHVMPYTGCRFLIVDSKPASVPFYERKGFVHMSNLEKSESTLSPMYLDLHRLTAV